MVWFCDADADAQQALADAQGARPTGSRSGRVPPCRLSRHVYYVVVDIYRFIIQLFVPSSRLRKDESHPGKDGRRQIQP